jgi:hypothetical protein
MAQSLILLWDRRRASGLLIEEGGSHPRCIGSFAHDWPDNLDPLSNPAQTAERLRSWLPAGAAPRRTVVCLSREDVILRHLEVPDVPDDELPAMVAFQAAARSTLPLDQLLLDFLPLRKPAGHEGRPVLAVTAPKTLVHGICAVLQAADCDAEAVSFSSVGIAEFVLQTERHLGRDVSRGVLCLVCDGPRVELVVLDDRRIVHAHAARLPAFSTPGLLAEVSRTLVAARQQNPGLVLDHAWLLGLAEHEAAELLARLSERIEAPSECLNIARADWADGSAKDVPAALLGLAAAETNRLTPPFDFLHPRRPPKKINLRKLRLAIGSAAALLLAAVVMGGVQSTLVRLERQREQLLSQEGELDVQLGPGKAILEAAQLISLWEAGNVNQLEHFAALEDLMEGTRQMYLSQYTFTVGQGGSPGTLQAFGNAKSRDDVVRFNQRLSDTKKYRIHPRGLTQSSRDDEYPHRFELSADLLAPVPNPNP